AKAANAGGVSVSQLEMAQNASMQRWTFEAVDNQLKVMSRSRLFTSEKYD
ncbi:MAG: NADP-specific glutamate dehydrogenase, partial [Azospira oryzae]